MKRNRTPGGGQAHPMWPGNLAAWALLVPSSELCFFCNSSISIKMLPSEFDGIPREFQIQKLPFIDLG
jgi:hypothetical protein